MLTHLRGDAPVVVTAVPFTDISVGAPDVESALEQLRPLLQERLASLEPVDLMPHLEEPVAELVRLPVEIQIEKGAEKLEIDAGVVIVSRRAKGREVVVAYVPVAPGVEVASRDRAAVPARAAAAVAKRLAKWTVTQVLASDEPAGSRLVVLDVELPERASDGESSERGILEELAIDLTRPDAPGIDGREELVRRVLEILAAPDRSSVLLVGPPDVGKTALVHEVGRRLALGEVPTGLRGRRLWRLSANELVAGAVYIGEWQERVRRFVEQARRTRAVCAMGDPVGLATVGRWTQSDNNVSRYLRPYVEDGQLTIVCEGTREQLAAAQRAEPSFVGALHLVEVAEPRLEQARAIVAAAAARLAEAAEVEIEPGAVEAAVELTVRYEPYRSFPGKAVRLLEEAVLHRGDSVLRLDRERVTAAFATRTGLPLVLLSESAKLEIPAVREHFESRVLGQPEATEAMVDLVMVLKAGLDDPAKPLGSFFFVGPTGVGKTELAKVLAEFLFGSRDRVVRFDMGEFASGDAVPRLIGRGWTGEEGELTRRVREQPFCVVLLDEVEKAHWSVFDALLALLGEGRLTDAAGRTADFRNAIVIMTSNLGAARPRSGGLGFDAPAAPADVRVHYVEQAEAFFQPEFFNRIDRIVVFHPLSGATVRQIARRELDQLLLREGIARRQLRVEIDDQAVERLAQQGLHPRYGARPLQREIERAVIEPLARLLVERRPSGRDFFRISLDNGRVAVSLQRTKEPTRPRQPRERRPALRKDALATARRTAEEFVDQLPADEAAELAARLRAHVSDLISKTHQPTFWNSPAAARDTLQRIYRLEHVLDRLQSLTDRAEGLVELARRLEQTRDHSRVQEVRTALDDMRSALTIVRLELAAAGGAGADTATVSVIPVGGAAAREWATTVAAMYRAWAERTARAAETAADEPYRVTIEGFATEQLLVGESGLHRRELADGTEILARVTVASPLEQPTPADAGAVVRIYEEGKRRVIRDPRTGAREHDIRRVLEQGHIDAFLLAYLRASPAAD